MHAIFESLAVKAQMIAPSQDSRILLCPETGYTTCGIKQVHRSRATGTDICRGWVVSLPSRTVVVPCRLGGDMKAPRTAIHRTKKSRSTFLCFLGLYTIFTYLVRSRSGGGNFWAFSSTKFQLNSSLEIATFVRTLLLAVRHP